MITKEARSSPRRVLVVAAATLRAAICDPAFHHAVTVEPLVPTSGGRWAPFPHTEMGRSVPPRAAFQDGGHTRPDVRRNSASSLARQRRLNRAMALSNSIAPCVEEWVVRRGLRHEARRDLHVVQPFTWPLGAETGSRAKG